MIRKILYIVVAIAIIVIGYHLYRANYSLTEVRSEFGSISASLNKLDAENEKLQSDIEYFSNPHNLEKEARSKFNYRAPGEKMIIVAPQ